MAITRVALVDDHELTRLELQRVLAKSKERVTLVASFVDAESFLASAVMTSIDVVLMDLGLPRMSGCEAIRALAISAPEVRALALTVFEDERHVLAALREGAFGYLLKDEPTERILRAIEEAAAGENPISARVAGFLIARARHTPAVHLSDRELELAMLLAQGRPYSECATNMGIALGTVQDYVKRLYRKLKINSRKEVQLWVERDANSSKPSDHVLKGG